MKKWLKLILVLALFASISIISYFVLRALGITNIETLRQFIEQFGKSGIIIFMLIETLLFTLLCFVPVMNTATVVMGIVLFGAKTTFFVSVIAGFLSASILFFIGDKFGEKFARKLIGADELDRLQNLVDSKSKILLPLAFLLPGMPDEAISLVAGMTKMKYRYFAIICLIFHSLDDLIVCFFGSNLINWGAMSVMDYIIFINIIIIDIYFIFKLQKYVENRNKN